MHAFWLVLTYDLLEDRHIDDVIIKTFLILYDIKPIDSKLLCICSVIHHRGRQNVVRTSVTHSAAQRVPLFCSSHILTSSVMYYCTGAQQLGIYLLIWYMKSRGDKTGYFSILSALLLCDELRGFPCIINQQNPLSSLNDSGCVYLQCS